ncbi:MAG: hypothetical protein ACI9JN_000262 [Bacteroidia bacterium]|jgi:hypothetical protein
MKKHSLKLLFLACIAILISCTDAPNPTTFTAPDFSEVHKYFPTQDGNKWDYKLKITDFNGTTTIFEQRAIYSTDSLALNFYRDDILWSWANWSNDGNLLRCCGDKILVDYGLLNCSSDSVSIYHNEVSHPETSIYQFCEKKFALDVADYKTIECIKTVQYNTFSNGNTLKITNFFGYGVGLVYRQQITFDELGVIQNQETLILETHTF